MNNMMKSIVADTILESRDKKFTNHSARKTVVNNLKKANVERSGIVTVTGHKNILLLEGYDEANKTNSAVCHFREEYLQSTTDSIQRIS